MLVVFIRDIYLYSIQECANTGLGINGCSNFEIFFFVFSFPGASFFDFTSEANIVLLL